MAQPLSKIAVLTSGGDAPGMNAALRAITLTCRFHGIEVLGFNHGYNGLLNNDYRHLDAEQVKHIIDLGGTLLKSARCPEFHHVSGLSKAAETLEQHQIDSLIVIGGDGSFRGALNLSKHWSGRIIGIPGTIDNDIHGTDHTIGSHTAIQTALEAIDKIRDTADAFDRTFLIEVMGRHSGFIALHSAIGSGAEQVLLPETKCSVSDSITQLIKQLEKLKQLDPNTSTIVIVAEKQFPGGLPQLAQQLKEQSGIDSRLCILGHIQRGGHPVAADRILATRLGAMAVEAACHGEHQIMIAEQHYKTVKVPLEQAVQQHHQTLDDELLAIQQRLYC